MNREAQINKIDKNLREVLRDINEMSGEFKITRKKSNFRKWAILIGYPLMIVLGYYLKHLTLN